MISEKWKNVLFILPAVAYMVALSFIPSIAAVRGSFQTNLSSFTTVNYTQLIQLDLYGSIVNTVVVTGLALLVQFIFGFLIATILTKAFVGKRIFSVLFLLPFGVATVVAGFVFQNIFYYTGGYANSLLTYTGIYHLFGIKSINWLSTYWNATFSLVISDSWKNTPIVALILLAGMNSISPDVYNQAYIDGAGPVSRFFRITLPNLSGFIAIALIIRGISEFNIFAIALLLYTKFPLLTTKAYGFFNGGGTDYEAYAASTVLLAFILVFAAIIIYSRSRSFKIQNGLKRTVNWFERFRWFYTSGGFLVISGRNDRSGSRILSKHFSNDDILIRSDDAKIPVTVIQWDNQGPVPMRSISEACSFALAFTDKWSSEETYEFQWQIGPKGDKFPIKVSPSDLEVAISDVSGEALPMVSPLGSQPRASGLTVGIRHSGNLQNSIDVKIARVLGIVPEPSETEKEPETARQAKEVKVETRVIFDRISYVLGISRKEFNRLLPQGPIEVTRVFEPSTATVLARRFTGGGAR